MQQEGKSPVGSNPLGGMPATDDEIREKYLERAIRELNHFTRELQSCTRCPRGPSSWFRLSSSPVAPPSARR